jgi:4a-hydroxytetrahydrobiopterin dehydratase
MRLTDDQIQEKLGETTGWERRGDLISRTFNFENFKEAMAFVNKAADIADAMDHHPDILISYNVVQLSVFTHSEGGLTDKDFQLAKKINEIL